RMSTEGNPELALLASYAEGDSLQEVMVNQNANGVITERQQQALDALEVVQELMAEREAAVREARNDVASAKKAADANVATISTLVDRAATTAATVSSLVSRTATARAAVVRARAADKAALRRL